MTIIPEPEFSNDRPLQSRADDRLNRAPFAERISKVLQRLPGGSGLVVGIHGPWGDGKTTVLNLLRADLECEGRAVVVEYNPWRFTDEASMLAGFFSVLAEAIRTKITTRGEDAAKLLGKISRVAAVADSRFATAAELVDAKAEANLEELRSRLSRALLEAGKRIIVLIDDIDRLDKHETHTLFRLVKACAEFPNICYVMAFDDIAVAKSLAERYGSGDEQSGRAFLEKIIQIPLKLPIAVKEDLRSFCLEQAERALQVACIELSNEQVSQFLWEFDTAILNRLDTPRAAKRYGNGLMFALPALKDEINVVDLMLIEAVRAFYPEIYDIIRQNYSEFSGIESGHASHRREGPRGTVLLKQHVDPLPLEEQDSLRKLLRYLFPRLNGGYGADWLSGWAKEKRICSPDYCCRYFTYSIAVNDIRESDLNDLLTLATGDDVEKVRSAFVTLVQAGKGKRLIQRLREREASIEPRAVESLCQSIASSAVYLPNPDSLDLWMGPISQAGILISHLIQRLPRGEARVALAKQVMRWSTPLWFGDEVLRWLHVTNDADKADANVLSEKELAATREVLIEEVKKCVERGDHLFSLKVRQEQGLLFEWCRVEGREPVQRHLASVFAKDPKNIAIFLQAMAPRVWGQGDALSRAGQLEADQLKNIELIFDLNELAHLIRTHLQGNFKDPQWTPYSSQPLEERLAEQFIFIYNKWKQDEITDGGRH